MKKLLNICLLVTFLTGYLEWGKEMHAFIFQAEADAFKNIKTDPASLFHPAILIPLFGQLTVIFTLFQKDPSKQLTYIGMACLCAFMLLLFITGLISLNFKIVCSTLPFFIVAMVILGFNRKKII
jgi:hypothetical protein